MILNILARKFDIKYNLYSKANISLDQSKIAPKAIEACKMLQDAGFKSYLVGGCVRDLLMGNSPKDWDICSSATPQEVREVFPKTYVVGDGEKNGTIVVKMGPSKDDDFEITTFRVEGEYADGRRPDSVKFVQNVEGDLSRRDLTINAIAYDPVNDKIVDPSGGLKDLENKIIRAVGDPNKRFEEDGLRTMRVARFAARFGFHVDPATKSAISNNLETLRKVSKERLKDELTKTLATKTPSIGLKILQETNALSVLGPVFDSSIQNTFHQIDSCQGNVLTKTAIILSNLDIGTADNTLRDLKFSNSDRVRVVALLKAKEEFLKLGSTISDVEIRRLMSNLKKDRDISQIDFNEFMSEFLKFGKSIGLDNIDSLTNKINDAPLTIKDLKINGKHLQDMGFKGKQLGDVLKSLLNKVVLDPSLNDESKLLELASKFEKMANLLLHDSILKKGNKDWWRLSDSEEQDLLNKEFDFGSGLKFKAKDIPELASQVEVPAGPQEHHPELNQLLHNNLVSDKARELSDDPMIWYGALMHDLGKSYTDKAIWPKQHGHEEAGVPYVDAVSSRLGVPEKWKEFAKLVAEHHLKCHRAQEMTPKTLKKLFKAFNNDKEFFAAYLTACEADAKGRLGGHALKPYDQKQYLAQQIEKGFEEKQNMPSTLAISGNDLQKELGLKPGPELGKILKSIKEMVEKDPSINEREILMGIARNLLVKS